jgi:hypothetical protein
MPGPPSDKSIHPFPTPQSHYITCVRTQSPDTSPEAERKLIELLQQTPIWRRMQLANEMSRTAREFALAGLRRRHPQASEKELRRRLADLHLGSELALKVYGPIESSTE